MNELDDKIREALRDEDADMLKAFDGEPSIFDLVMQTFRGRHRWLAMFSAFWSVVFCGLCIYCGVRFFSAEAPREQLLWAVGVVLTMSAVSMLKIWFWMELNKNAIMREIKRLELQIARLAGRIKD